MIKFAKIVNEETKACEVGTGNNTDFYKSIGMTELDVEKCDWNGFWYLAGYCPKKPEELIKKEQLYKLQQYLDDTDWYITRFVDNGTPIPEDIKANRQKAREEINKLRG